MTVYSKRLVTQAVPSDTPTVVYTVPTGIVTVIKRIIAVSITAAGNVGYIFTLNGTANVNRIYRQDTIGPNVTLDLETRYVMNAGDQLYLRRLTNNLVVSVHGYELQA